MSYCTRCAQHLPASIGSACPLCGQGLVVPPPGPAPAPQAQQFGVSQGYEQPRTGQSNLGAVALILGFVGLAFFPAAFVAIVMGHAARKPSRGAADSDRTLALVGMILGYIVAFFIVVMILAVLVLVVLAIGASGVERGLADLWATIGL